MNLEKNTTPAQLSQEAPAIILTEPQFKELAHLPLLTLFYFSLQRKFSIAPVTALELAAYLGIEVKTAESVLEYLEKKDIVRAFKNEIPAYSLAKNLEQINAGELVALLGKFHELMKERKDPTSEVTASESGEKYRKIYSDLASEILQLFGERAANQLPL